MSFDGLEVDLKIPSSCVSKSRIADWDYEVAHFSNSQSNRMLAASLSHKPSGIHIIFKGDNNAKTIEDAITGRIEVDPHSYNINLLNSTDNLPAYKTNDKYSMVRASFFFDNVAAPNGSKFAPTEQLQKFFGAASRKYSVVGVPSLFFPSDEEMVKLIAAFRLNQTVYFGYFVIGADRNPKKLREPHAININGIGDRIFADIEELGAAYDRGLISHGCKSEK